MKNNYLLKFVTVAFLLLVISACGKGNNESTDTSSNTDSESNETSLGEKIEIRLGHVLAESTPSHEAFLQFSKNVSDRTDGMVDIKIFPNSTLGSETDVLEQAKLNTPVISYTNPTTLQDTTPDISILHGPFLVEDFAELQKVLESDFMEEQKEALKEKGLRVLAANWYFGARHLISDRAVENPDDLKGAKIRSLPSVLWEETISAMGANPTSLEWAEVYPGLEQGVIDGAEAPLQVIYSSNLHEVADHVSLTGHFKPANIVLISEEVFASLPEEYGQILMEEAEAAGKFMTELTIEQEDEYEERLKEEGVTITTPDLEAFKKATEKVYEKLSKDWSEGNYEKVKAILEN